MILDMQAAFCFSQPITVDGSTSMAWTAGTHNAGFQNLGYIDLGAMDAFALNTNTGTVKMGVGKDLYLISLLTVAMNDHPTTPVATLTPILQTADDAAFGSNLTTVLAQTAFAAHTVAGTRRVNALPADFDYRRYLRMLFTVGGGPLTAGTISCWLSLDFPTAKTFYPDRMSIIAG